MNKNSKKPPHGSVSPASEGFWSNLLFLPINDICTNWSGLRSGHTRVKASELLDMPIRVVLKDSHYEVIDGFKRLDRWKQAGVKHVPVLVEQLRDGLNPKQLLLDANSPKRTICALDEARVIESMIKDDGLTVRSVANILGRRKEWVIGRRSLLRLSSGAQGLLATGRINLMVARLLTAISPEGQDTILEAVAKHGMKMREIQLLLQTWRAASDEEKPALLSNPLFKSAQQDSPGHSARLKALEAKLSAIRTALDEFSNFLIPQDLADAEQRRLQAICASIQNQITQMAEGFKNTSPHVAQLASEIQQPTDYQPLVDDDYEDSNDDSEFLRCFPSVPPCHLSSPGSLGCDL